jgi:hypothetical protein
MRGLFEQIEQTSAEPRQGSVDYDHFRQDDSLGSDPIQMNGECVRPNMRMCRRSTQRDCLVTVAAFSDRQCRASVANLSREA